MRDARELVSEHESTTRLLEEHAAVTFLAKDHASILRTVLDNTFTSERAQISAAEFEAETQAILNTLAAAGHRVPRGPVRTICRGWVDGGWLRLEPTGDGGETYTRTAETHDALGYLRDLAVTRRGSAVSNVPAFLEKVESLAVTMSGDTEKQTDLLHRQIARLEERLAAIEAGDTGEVDLNEFITGYDTISSMLSGIDLGFRHVADRLWQVQRQKLDEINLDGGDAIAQMRVGDDAWTELVAAPEGRAVEDALAILQDPESRHRLTKNIAVILAHEYAEALQPWERKTFGDLAALLHGHVGPLVDANRRGTAELNVAFRKQAARMQDRHGLDEVIRRARRALSDYSGRRLPDGVVPRLPRLDVGCPPGRLPDTITTEDPVALADLPISEARPIDAAEAARWSGPHEAEVLTHIDSTLTDLGAGLSIADLWNAAPEHLRRSVELVVYYAYAHRAHSEGRTSYLPGAIEDIKVLAPDGTTSGLTIQRIVLAPPAPKIVDTQESTHGT